MIKWNQKRVFVSGGAGVIGTALVTRLLDLGAVVLVGDLKPQPEAWKGVLQYRQGDLISLTLQEVEEFSPEVFFHLAATFERSEETEQFWEENFHHNIALSHHLMTLLKDLPSLKTVVFASSYLVYDPSLYLFPTLQQEVSSLKENSAIAPRNLCGIAKLLHEQELAFIKKFRPHLQTISARIFRSYGKGSRDVISRWIRSLLQKEPITVYCPEGRFDYVYAEDVADGLLQLATTSYNGVVNLGSGVGRSIREVLDILSEHFGALPIEQASVAMAYESSQSEMSLFHRLVPQQVFRPLETTIPLLIHFEQHQKNQHSFCGSSSRTRSDDDVALK